MVDHPYQDQPLHTPATLHWSDGAGKLWSIELGRDAIVLTDAAGEAISFPRDRWPQDILLLDLDGRIGVRFERFDGGANFIVSPQVAAPLLSQLQARPISVIPTAEELAPPPQDGDRVSLLWPKVSPLAVWALICSTLVCVPLLGILPAVATVILLTLHRKRVRRSAAFRHSRLVCSAAFAFLSLGLVASGLGAVGCLRNGLQLEDEAVEQADEPPAAEDAVPGDAPTVADPDQARLGPDLSLLAQGFLSGKHNWGLIAAGFIVIVLSLSLHEAGHAVSAWWLGDDLARRQGRVTINPLAHIDLFGTILLPLMLFMTNQPVFGFARPVPVRTDYLVRPRRAHILISLAGPGANLLIAAGAYILLMILGCLVDLLAPGAKVEGGVLPCLGRAVSASGFAGAAAFSGVYTVLNLAFYLNVFLAAFNLIPIPPLDGSWVLEHLFPNTLGRVYAAVRPYAFIVFLLFVYSDAGEVLMLPGLLLGLLAMLVLSIATGMPVPSTFDGL